MIQGLKPYPAYKDSGVPWLGEVPEHWDVLPNRALFVEVKDQNHPNEPLLSVTITRGVIPQERLLTETSKKDSSNLDKSKYKLVQPGDVAYNKMRAWQGAIGVSRHKGIVSPAYIVQCPRPGLSPEYVHHLLRTPAFAKEAARWSYGITSDQWSLRAEHFKMIYSARPPIEEQSAIVRFLGHVDRKIQRAIRAKQRLVKLLEEEKQVLIHRAVTGQIDVRTGKPYPAYKPSGVEWLGDVPEHWTISRVKNEFICLNSRRVPLSGTERGEMTLRLYDYYGASGAIDKVDSYIFDDDLLLIAEDGANLVLRNLRLAIIARGKYWVNNHAHILKPRRGDLEFLAELMECLSFVPWISGAAQPKLTQERLMRITIAVPYRDEQEVIMQWLRKRTAALRDGIEKEQRQVILLREYRARLVADVVTGKLDLREAAARFPAEPEVEVEAPEPDEDLDLPQAAEEEGSYEEPEADPSE